MRDFGNRGALEFLTYKKQFVGFNFVNFLLAIAGREHGFQKG